MTALPTIIQGGMGIAVSGWPLARAVAQRGQLGVVSGTAIDTVLVRRLQDGDRGGDLRRAIAAFPLRGVADFVLRRYFLPDGRPPGTPYRLLPMYQREVDPMREAITVLGAFCEVFLAREGHRGRIGINLLTKVQRPNPAALYGAMLAGVDVVIMGAGIPRDIPTVLDALAVHEAVTLRLELTASAPDAEATFRFAPATLWSDRPPPLKRPAFLPIVASNSLATLLARKAGGIDGFIVEGPTAGGHNAPPRGTLTLDATGQPRYGPRDVVDLAALRELGLPFWIAGGAGHPEQLRLALAQGAAGIQVGTLFAWCTESGIEPTLRTAVLEAAARGEAHVFTDPLASPTGYPFKVVRWPDAPSREHRERICDLGYLRSAVLLPSGKMRQRCPAEPVDQWEYKGGAPEETAGRACLCNALLADVGLGQTRDGIPEPPLLTSGDDLAELATFLGGRTAYSAAEALDWLLGG